MLIRKLFKAEMAHMVPGAYTKRCHYLHGHSYKFEVFLQSNLPNPAFMVADFQAVKDSGLNDFFDSFDHAVMLGQDNPTSKLIRKINPQRHLIVPFNPTAEMIAKAGFMVARAILAVGRPLSGEQNVSVKQVIVHETDTGFAVFRSEDVEDDRFPRIHFNDWIISDGIKADWKNKFWFKRVLRYFKQTPL